MPVTRSQSGKPMRPFDEATTGQLECPLPLTPDHRNLPAPEEQRARSISSSSIVRRIEIARVRAEEAKARMEEAKARAEMMNATLERLIAEEAGSENGSVIEDELNNSQRRVNMWLEDAATIANPEEDRGVPPAEFTEQIQETLEKAKETNGLPPPSSQPAAFDMNQIAAVVASATAMVQAQKNAEITQLVSAIVKAPRVSTTELPYFNGAFQEWLCFKRSFEETVHLYSDTENLARLRRCLKGKARDAVERYLYTASSPETVMKTLEIRFGRPDSIAMAELELLRSLPRPSDNPRDLCIFASKVSNVLAALKALNRIHYLYNPEVTTTTIEKLSPSLRYAWYNYAQQQHSDEPDLVKLARFLEDQAEAASPYARPEFVESRSQHSFKKPEQLHRTFTARDEKRKQTCVLCEKPGHAPEECSKIKEALVKVRWELAKEKNLCFRCLCFRQPKHSCKTKACGIDECHRTHHPLLHHSASDPVEIVEKVASASTSQALLKILPIRVSGPKGHVDTFALLDDGSTVSLVDAKIAKAVGATGPIDPLKIEAIGGGRIDNERSQCVTLQLQGQNKCFNIKARTLEGFSIKSQKIDEKILQKCKHLHDIVPQLSYSEAKPSILIGQDNCELLLSKKTRKGRKNLPMASLTPLGWVLHGSNNRILGKQVHYVAHVTDNDGEDELIDKKMDEDLKKFFAIESLCIQPKNTRNDPEERALKILQQNTEERKEGGYETSLLWKHDNLSLPNNYENALRRLYNTEKRLDREPILKMAYEKQVQDLVNKGYAEEAPIEITKNRTWYLPHFAVIHPSKPGKVRMVFDAAHRAKGTSLNDQLLAGPDLLQSLPGVLMRFRQHEIAVAADIEEMFLRIGIKSEDRDALRFLWRGNRREGSPIEYRMKSVIFGAACSPCTALYVKNWNAELHKDQYPGAAEAIIIHHYMDDYLQSFQTLEEAKKISKDVQLVHKKANFNLRKWTSNHPEIVIEMNGCEAKPENDEISFDSQREEKILGMKWIPSTDTLGFSLNFAKVSQEIVDGRRTPTKREALKTVMSLYDPLGLVSPLTIQAKKILQETWRTGTGWDESLPKNLTEKWKLWIKGVQELKYLRIPRCHPQWSHAVYRELHIFVDASESAYGAAVYWRVVDKNNSAFVSLAVAKARVTPLKLTSIPRLELQAALLGSRLAKSVETEYQKKPDRRIFWSDSKTVLAWLRAGPRAYKPFVAHRIAEIEEETSVYEWRWVPTRDNVADDTTRDVPKNFGQNHRWFVGPQFLYKSEDSWPKEVIQNFENTGEERVNTVISRKDPKLIESIPDVNRFSKWERYLRSTARVLQFIQLCKKKSSVEQVFHKRTKKNKEENPSWKAYEKKAPSKYQQTVQNPEKRKYKILSASLQKKAESLIVRASQEISFADDLKELHLGEPVSSNSRLRSLAVELINGVITLKTRIDAASDIPTTVKRPPILDGNHKAVRLFIDHVHRRLHHAGVETTINECRQFYWVLRLRPTARTVIGSCLPCRIRRNSPSVPPTGNHPYSRLAHHQRPFSFVGVDYFGPLTVTVGRTTQKRYVALFTCLTTRAVHLEMAASLSTDSAIMALRRMIARRGCPSEIWSDNGTNLKGADRELRLLLDTATEEEASKRMIKWRFIPPGAPFMGGAWERLVRSVKVALATTLKSRHPSEEVLVTLLAEAEYTVNSRPLTHVSVNPEDPEAITPNHILLGGSAAIPVDGSFTDSDCIGRCYWRASQRLADLFWSRWIREYLPDLQNRREPHGSGLPLKIGNIVLIVDGTLPRNTWLRGIVIAVYPGPDGVVRTADIRTKGGILRRPTKKLVILPTDPPVKTEE